METLYYYSGFNNYFNRQIKKPTSTDLSDFEEWLVKVDSGINFNPNDNVTTKITLNYNFFDTGTGEVDWFSDSTEIDYIIVTDEDKTDVIKSRWFVTERSRNLGGQWDLILHRDLLADYFELLRDSTFFINKATISNNITGNKLIFNSEGFNTNQIKTKEVLLKDSTGCGWIVGYISASSFDQPIAATIPATGTQYPAPPFDYQTLNKWQNIGVYKSHDTWNVAYAGSISLQAKGWRLTTHSSGNTWAEEFTWTTREEMESLPTHTKLVFKKTSNTKDAVNQMIRDDLMEKKSEITEALYAYNKTLETREELGETDFNTLLQMNGQIYSDGSKVFKVNVSNIGDATRSRTGIDSTAGGAYSLLSNVIKSYAEFTQSDLPSGINIDVHVSRLNISVEEQALPSITATIPNTVKILKDSPYRMFAIPLGTPNTLNAAATDITDDLITNTDAIKYFATNLATVLGGTGTSFIYDLQYLPYCPAREFIDPETGFIELGRGTEGRDYSLIKTTEDEQVVGYLLWATSSSFSFSIIDSSVQITVPMDNAVDFKVANETQMVRICSPNYSGCFEFKPTYNYGVTGFEVNCTYKPFQPYIHVNPIFNEQGLYGGDFNDQRGLVCTGDFSLSIVDDHWIDYQIANKSYQDAHQRQIQSMDTMYQLNYEREKLAGTIGAVTSGISGAGMGAMAGGLFGPAGMLAGGLLGAVGGAAMSSWGLSKDLQYMEAQQAEQKSLAKDMFNYGIRNVQALPSSLGKVSAFTKNNKVFPFIEFYDCTEEEKKVCRLKLKYNGFTINKVDTLGSYLNSGPDGEVYIQGQVVRLKGPCEYHESNAITDEFVRGVYIQWE